MFQVLKHMIHLNHVKICLVFLNEIYRIHGKSYQTIIKEMKTDKFQKYINRVLDIKVFVNLVPLLGLMNDQHRIFINKQCFSCKNTNYTITEIISNNRVITKMILQDVNDICWLEKILALVASSDVIQYSRDQNEFIIEFNFGLVKTNNTSFWEKCLNRILASQLDEKRYVIQLYPPNKKYDFHVLNELINSHWNIDDDILEKFKAVQIRSYRCFYLVSAIGESQIKKILINWLRDIDWSRKREYYLTINRIYGTNCCNSKFYTNFIKLEKYTRMIILSYL